MSKKSIFGVLFCITILLFSFIPLSHQHGLGYEILPPVIIDGKKISLEVNSLPGPGLEPDSRSLTFALLDVSNTITIRNVEFQVKGIKGGETLFEEKFNRDNGILEMKLISDDSNFVSLAEEEQEGGFFESLIGSKNLVVEAKGSVFETGGLYNFEVTIFSIEDYNKKLEEPVKFDVGISFPDTSYFQIDDNEFGDQLIEIVTFYDLIEEFDFDDKTKSIKFSMPFIWSFENINQTSVVHEEISIPKKMGNLMISNFTAFVNSYEVPNQAITIDDFYEDNRIIHLVINQKLLLEILPNMPSNQNNMEFILKPAQDNLPLSTVTKNGQYRIILDWQPSILQSNSNAKFLLKTEDVFLIGKPISLDYQFTIKYKDEILKSGSGKTTDSKEIFSEMEFEIPSHVNGPISLELTDLNGNEFADAEFFIYVKGNSGDEVLEGNVNIPSWIKNNAGWWAEDLISDQDFVKGIEFLIKTGIMKIS